MVKSFMNKKSIAVFSKLVIIISFEFICFVFTEKYFENKRNNCILEPDRALSVHKGCPLYIALFPHVFGYSEILSLFFKIFGTTTQLPKNSTSSIPTQVRQSTAPKEYKNNAPEGCLVLPSGALFLYSFGASLSRLHWNGSYESSFFEAVVCQDSTPSVFSF